jgi:hypothetical protein
MGSAYTESNHNIQYGVGETGFKKIIYINIFHENDDN